MIERAVPPAATRAPAPVHEQKPDAPGTYTVHKGDTLIRIALDHGLNYRDLAAWNNLADPDDIKVDQVLRLEAPAHVATAPVAQPKTEVVKPAVPRKTEPKADKKPYSESAMAEMQKEGAKPEAAPAPAAGGIAPGATVTATDDEKLSWMWPTDGKVVATFDEGKNKGIDIAGKAGQQVLAAGAGKVMYAGSGVRGYGNLVVVKHSNSLLSAYAHNRAIVVKEGQTVNKGQIIAEMGDTDADAVKLHFEIRQQGKPVDPTKFLPSR
ncbi:MAG TPA: peptidoglycan DD-metalloendopeptidase family protein [Telluria sp.]|nr:peptidoglycan DD-metalloendopeptidase family protein [Telluria sp.]